MLIRGDDEAMVCADAARNAADLIGQIQSFGRCPYFIRPRVPLESEHSIFIVPAGKELVLCAEEPRTAVVSKFDGFDPDVLACKMLHHSEHGNVLAVPVSLLSSLRPL